MNGRMDALLMTNRTGFGFYALSYRLNGEGRGATDSTDANTRRIRNKRAMIQVHLVWSAIGLKLPITPYVVSIALQ